MLTVLDEALSPIPPGIRVTVTDQSGNVQVGYTIAGGGVPAITVLSSTTYTVTFYGERGPGLSVTLSFNTNSYLLDSSGGHILDSSGNWILENPAPTAYTLVVAGYRSPYLSASAAQALQAEMFPLRRAGQNAPTTAAIQAAVGARAAAIDGQTQAVHGALRLQSSSGAAVDSWAVDFLGGLLPRNPGETDTAYIARIIAWLRLPFGTLYAIQYACNAWVAQWVGVPSRGLSFEGQGAFDGGGGSLDGGVSSAIVAAPNIEVFDTASNPVLAAAVGLVATKGQFAILFAFAPGGAVPQWFLGQSGLGAGTYLAATNTYTPLPVPPMSLDALIRVVKPGGTTPVYAVNGALP